MKLTSGSDTSEKPKESKKVTRRQFIVGTVGGVVVGAAIGAAAGSLAFPKTVTEKPWLPAKWDNTADVVILGTGLAGLSTAISAYDAGAKVLILEKLDQAHEGGNSRVSGNMFWAPDDVTLGAEYIKAATFGQDLADPSIFTFLAQGLKDNLTEITQMGSYYGSIFGIFQPEWPMMPGSSTVKTYGIAATAGGTGQTGGGYLWQLFKDAVNKRSISIMYDTPATDLIQNADTKEILGVKATSNGSTINVKANKAVVLALGGLEFNYDLQAQYLQGWPIYGYGSLGNTGDGIKMAEAVGADMWKMTDMPGGTPSCLIVPDFKWPIAPLGTIGTNYIWVNKLGDRYVNETLGMNHGWGVREHTMMFDGVNADFMAIPTWLVFDETSRLSGPLKSSFPGMGAFGAFAWFSDYTWSKDNSTEIAKGWITKADSISDLASAIAADADNSGPEGHPWMTASELEATIAKFNGYATAGNDLDFGREAATMAPIVAAPFYAVKLWPGVYNTQGGARRDINCAVVDKNGNPIPRLYGTGEFGSFWGQAYNGGGNLGECMLTGRVAGKNAAGLTNWT